ncbi:MAG: hypothetical protein RSC25_05315, partial [Christensenella sp.]
KYALKIKQARPMQGQDLMTLPRPPAFVGALSARLTLPPPLPLLLSAQPSVRAHKTKTLVFAEY